MSIATFESPQVASQQFFPWVFDEDAACGYSDSEPVEDFVADVDCPSPVASAFMQNALHCESRSNNQTAIAAGAASRLGTPVRLGAVMLKLLKSYGITDEEIAEGMAAYAANAGLAHAG